MNAQIGYILKKGESILESCDQVIFRKKQGALLISDTRLLWFKLDSSASIDMSTLLSLPMSKVKSVQSSLPNQKFTLLRIEVLGEPAAISPPPKNTSIASEPSNESVIIFRFVGASCEKDRDAVKSLIARLISDRWKIRGPSLDASPPATSESPEKPDLEDQAGLPSGRRERSILSLEIDPRYKHILKQHDYIYMLYAEFVGLGIVSSEEFWQMNEDWVKWEQECLEGKGVEPVERDQPPSLSDQVVVAEEVALPNSFVDRLRSSLQKGRLRLTLTPLLIREIFFEFPSVEKAYQSKVPLEMSHIDFWNRFFRSQVSKLQCMERLAPHRGASRHQDVNGSPGEGKREYVVDDATFSLFPASSSERASGTAPRGVRTWIDPKQVDAEFAMLTNYEGTQSYVEKRLTMKNKAAEANRSNGAGLEAAKRYEPSDLERLQTELGLNQSAHPKIDKSEDVLNNQVELDEEEGPNPELEMTKKRSVYLQLIRKFNRYGDLVVANIQATEGGAENGEPDRSKPDVSVRTTGEEHSKKFSYLDKSVDKWRQSKSVLWVDSCTEMDTPTLGESEVDWISAESRLVEDWRNWNIPHVLASNAPSLPPSVPPAHPEMQEDPFRSRDFIFRMERSSIWRRCFWSLLSLWLSRQSPDLEEKLKKIRVQLSLCHQSGLRVRSGLPEASAREWERIYLLPIERAISVYEKVFQ
ncbi:uncharacterized protein LOC126330799 [Schistocerca gregaria]|uniref:uncharacterized protein LOC126330799 n=1 Tax=Schistocerca gregaria TaxID=7010 RepID=UPI00211E3C57|nr:uncharacterized protein LOC126330799 [Schistocerca gregaria]